MDRIEGLKQKTLPRIRQQLLSDNHTIVYWQN